MPFQTGLTILICFILGMCGCMKTVQPTPPMAPPAAPRPQVVLNGPYDSEIPERYLDHLRAVSGTDDETLSRIFLGVADQFAARGEVEKAIHFLDRAAEGFVRSGHQSGEAAAWSRKVILLSDFNRETEALDLLHEAGKKWTEPPLNAFPGYVEGRFSLLRGDFPRSLMHLTRSLQNNAEYSRGDHYLLLLRRDTELDAGISSILAEHLPGLLAIYGGSGIRVSGTHGAGEGHLRNALALNEEVGQVRDDLFLPETGFQKVEAEARNFLGLALWMRGDKDQAVRQLTTAGELSKTAGSPAMEIHGLLFMGELGFQGEYEPEGRTAAELLRDRADRCRNPSYRIWARLLMARYERQWSRNRAIGWLREAAGIIEAQRGGLKADIFEEVCRRQRRIVYESLVELLAGEGMVGEALTSAEKAKTLMMVDLMDGVNMGRNAAEKRLLEQESALLANIRGLQRAITKVPEGAVADDLRERLDHAEESRRELIGRIGEMGGGLVSLVTVNGAEPAALQRLLDRNTTIFDYFTTESTLYVWAVHRERVHLERIDLSRKELRALIFSFLAAIRDRDRRKTETLSRKTYDLLIKPVISFISGERIGFIPDDVLTYLPFAAMSYRGRFLAEGFSIFLCPQADLLEQLLGESRTTRLRILAFGNPDLDDETLDLDHGVLEVERIRKRIGDTTVLFREQATESRVGNLPPGYDILHFAVRGQFVPEDPLNSGLLLTPGAGQDGRLTVREVFGLRFHGRAVVLSGCDPAMEGDPEGKGLISMQRAFLHTGSPSVISNLWPVEDIASARLLELFYLRMEKKEPIADALRDTQLRMIREGHAPYIWAAFVLTGKY